MLHMIYALYVCTYAQSTCISWQVETIKRIKACRQARTRTSVFPDLLPTIHRVLQGRVRAHVKTLTYGLVLCTVYFAEAHVETSFFLVCGQRCVCVCVCVCVCTCE